MEKLTPEVAMILLSVAFISFGAGWIFSAAKNWWAQSDERRKHKKDTEEKNLESQKLKEHLHLQMEINSAGNSRVKVDQEQLQNDYRLLREYVIRTEERKRALEDIIPLLGADPAVLIRWLEANFLKSLQPPTSIDISPALPTFKPDPHK